LGGDLQHPRPVPDPRVDFFIPEATSCIPNVRLVQRMVERVHEIQDAEDAEQGERDAVGDRGGGCSVQFLSQNSSR
jgi:hypothetical protein